jgi:hypothetical protein
MLFAFPAQGEMYVGGYIGGTQAADSGMSFLIPHSGGPRNPNDTEGADHLSINGTFRPSVMGGLKAGAWFDQTGSLSEINFPRWMQYLGFYLDFNFHRLNFSHQSFTSGVSFYRQGVVTPSTSIPSSSLSNTRFSTNGTAATLAFMFAGRYGFFPDSEVPFGRLQPFLAVGPAILFSNQIPTMFPARINTRGVVRYYALESGSQSSADIALAVESGIRWMASKHVSLELSFKYRYAKPSYVYEFFDSSTRNGTTSVEFNPTYNLFSGQMGVAYHF